MQIDNAALARQLGYSKEQMIEKFGNPGEKSPQQIANTLGLDNSTMTSIFGTPQNTDTTNFSNVSIGGIIDSSFSGIDNDAIAQQVGYSKDEMIEKFGNPGEKSPQEIGNTLGLDYSEISRIFGEDLASVTTQKTETVDSFTKTQDDKYKQVADALGYDELSVSAVMKAIAGGTNGNPEEIVPQLAYDLGLPQTFVSNVLSYLNKGQI